MQFRPDALPGAPAGGLVGATGRISFRLARNSVVSEFQKGRLSRLDVCDAHPELIRAARGVGHATQERCPICEEDDLVLVTYVFGPRMPPQGKCVTTAAELAKLDRGTAELSCYVVEVCPACSWNHLASASLLGRSARSARTRSSGAR